MFCRVIKTCDQSCLETCFVGYSRQLKEKFKGEIFDDKTSMQPLSQASMTKWLKIQTNKLGFSHLMMVLN